MRGVERERERERGREIRFGWQVAPWLTHTHKHGLYIFETDGKEGVEGKVRAAEEEE